MKRGRQKLVHKRKPQADDLSFMPPYADQARYIDLANAFLSLNGDHRGHRDIVGADEPPPLKRKVL
jgi:hypothetical protein